jgi:hypothetical protein
MEKHHLASSVKLKALVETAMTSLHALTETKNL